MNILKFNSIEAGYDTKLPSDSKNLFRFLIFDIDIIIYNHISMDENNNEYLQSLLNPSIGARSVNAICDEAKKQGKPYDNKTKSGFTLAKIKKWYDSREKAQTHKRVSAYHSFTPERPKQQFQIDIIALPKPWRNNK